MMLLSLVIDKTLSAKLRKLLKQYFWLSQTKRMRLESWQFIFTTTVWRLLPACKDTNMAASSPSEASSSLSPSENDSAPQSKSFTVQEDASEDQVKTSAQSDEPMQNDTEETKPKVSGVEEVEVVLKLLHRCIELHTYTILRPWK